MTQQPVYKKNIGISSVWLLPFIALCICCWLLYSHYQNAGKNIVVSFNDASGIVPGKTQVLTRGIPVGLVKQVKPDLYNNQVKVFIEIKKEAAQYLVEDSVFWVVRPELSVNAVQGLDTILSGIYIGIQPGNSDVPSSRFQGLSSMPPVPADTPGLHLQLKADSLGSIREGTGIYYKNLEIGKVETYRLVDDKDILMNVFINQEYSHLVREGSRFCNASGIELSGKLTNFKLRIESITSLLRGGILLYTPETLLETPQAKNGKTFPLYKDYQAANYGTAMTLTLNSGKGIFEGVTKLVYRGIEAGIVQKISINNDANKTVTAHIFLDPRAEFILKENTKFWLVKPEIGPSGLQNVQLLFSGAYITFQPGDGKFRNHFIVEEEPPNLAPLRPGRFFFLVSSAASTINKGSPVSFKNIKVGEVVDITIDKFGEKIRTKIYIYEEHLSLLSKRSVFWTQSGLAVSGSLGEGLSVSTGPMNRILQGGVCFITPTRRKNQAPPEEETSFPLFASYEEAVQGRDDFTKAGKPIKIIASGIKPVIKRAPIFFKHVKIGQIESRHLAKGGEDLILSGRIFNKYTDLVNQTTRFYQTSGIQISGGLSGLHLQTKTLQSILTGGINCINVPGTEIPKDQPYPLYETLEAALATDTITISVRLPASKGIKVGSSLRYKGIDVGRVQRLELSDDLNIVEATLRVEAKTEPLFRSKTKIWVSGVTVGLDGIENLGSALFGPFLDMLPGGGEIQHSFTAATEPPLVTVRGLEIILETSHLGSIEVGSPIYYRQVQVGLVTGYQLSPSFQTVSIKAMIDDQYRPIIRQNTKFWNVSGARLEGGIFSGLTIATESLKSIISGGIALATPDEEQTSEPVQSGHHFTLYDKADPQWLDWSPDVIEPEKMENNQRQ
ncbi:MAG: hypothetical protein CSA20_04230 [Deltaproteobacteria bacterium]|nr:MAG: hypothetical protein CSA20_04230 [Deltaproteobacteria bacterium]